MKDYIKWVSDIKKSSLGFKIKSLTNRTVIGKFMQFEVRLEIPGTDLEYAQIEFTAQADSITTGNHRRDQHLRKANSFDTEKFPLIKFSSRELERVDKNTLTLYGDLTIKGVTNWVCLEIKESQIIKNPEGRERIGLRIKSKINQKYWGIDYNTAMKTDGWINDEMVEIKCKVQMIKQQVGISKPKTDITANKKIDSLH